jgi:uncharacterized protein (DUF1697 family)
MPVMISMLRGVNVGGRHTIAMDALRAVYEALGIRDAQTCVQSGNVVFKTSGRDQSRLAERLEDAIERRFGFRPRVILRSAVELKEIAAANPFVCRGADPGKVLIMFLAGAPDANARNKLLSIVAPPEELHAGARELHIYYPHGVGRAALSPALIEKVLQTPGTGRNWNTVTKMLAIAEKMESAAARKVASTK